MKLTSLALVLALSACTETVTEIVTKTDTLRITDTIAVSSPLYRAELLASGFDLPVAAQPDASTVLVAEQGGKIKRLNGSIVLDLSPLLPVDLNFVKGLQNFLSVGDRRFVFTSLKDGMALVAEIKGTRLDTLLLTGDLNDAHYGGGMVWWRDRLVMAFGDGETGDGRRPDRLTGKVVAINTATRARTVLASGLRNPWRMALDGDSLWIADAGDRLAEEINVLDLRSPGADFGWGLAEGDRCLVASCPPLTAPVYSYPTGPGCSTVVGGVVHRGRFWFADYCEGWVRSIGRDGSVLHHFDTGELIVGLASVGANELPVVITGGGSLLRVVPR